MSKPLSPGALRTGLIALAAVLTLGSAMAEKPEWAGHGNGKHGHSDKSDRGPRHDRGDDRHGRDDRKQDKKREREYDKQRHRAERDRREHWEDQRDRDRRHAYEDPRERDRDRHDRYSRPPAVVITPGGYFNDSHRRYARDWYGQQVRTGHCPPGLAKKHNGCMPPGQARKWAVGRPLPAGVAYYAVPQPILVQLGPPPSGYRYGRVANDIVLMPVGSRLVVDAIIDLGQLF